MKTFRSDLAFASVKGLLMKAESGSTIRTLWPAVTAVLVLILWASIVAAMDTLDQQLIEAAKVGDPEQVKTLLDGGADVTATNNDGTTALMAASGGDHVEVVQLLLDRNVDVDAIDCLGETALGGLQCGSQHPPGAHRAEPREGDSGGRGLG